MVVVLLCIGIWAIVVLAVLTVCRAASRADEQNERAARRLAEAGKRSRTIGLVTAATALGAHASSAPSAEARPSCASPPRGSPAPEMVAAVSCRISALRQARGLDGVHRRRGLAVAARHYATDMAVHDFFSHVSPEGSRLRDRITSSGYANGRCAWHVGEVLAWGDGEKATAQATIRAWLHSPPHRRVLLTRGYDDVGVGVAQGDPVGSDVAPAITVAALLGHRRC
jgi:uncharacterized protein YkwD